MLDIGACTCGEDWPDRLECLTSFNRHVAHDVGGSLVTMAGAAKLARQALDQGDSAMAARLLPMLETKADDLHRLVTELMVLAEADAPMQRQPVDLNALAASALDEVRLGPHAAPNAVVQVDPLPVAHGSPALLRQVFVNLMTNSLKFSRERERPHVHVSESTTQGRLSICVQDNGVGFAPHQAKHLFQPFSRLHGAAYAGHGIGLCFVRRVVERHGGQVWALPLAPHGAAFHFSLPGTA